MDGSVVTAMVTLPGSPVGAATSSSTISSSTAIEASAGGRFGVLGSRLGLGRGSLGRLSISLGRFQRGLRLSLLFGACLGGSRRGIGQGRLGIGGGSSSLVGFGPGRVGIGLSGRGLRFRRIEGGGVNRGDGLVRLVVTAARGY